MTITEQEINEKYENKTGQKRKRRKLKAYIFTVKLLENITSKIDERNKETELKKPTFTSIGYSLPGT
jgi:hypothetical protein